MTVRRTHLGLAVAALAAAVLYNFWYFVLRPVPADPARPAMEQPLAATAGGATASAARDPLTIPAPPEVDLTTPPSWRRDPFLFGDETRAVARPAARVPAAPEPVVRSILHSSNRRLAIVDGRIVAEGDVVGDYTVSAIERGAVVFTTPGGGRLRVPVHAAAPR
jgi:hypothetical protein